MKRLAVSLCLAVSCLCFTIPAGAKTNNSVYAQSRAQRKAQKKQQKEMKKYLKAKEGAEQDVQEQPEEYALPQKTVLSSPPQAIQPPPTTISPS